MLIPGRNIGRMGATKKQAGVQKLVGSKKTAQELAVRKYQRQLELAIENH